jgi:glycolate oxidase iron-sulfur subunit
MQTQIPKDSSHDVLAATAAGLIGRCVHCGFCNATCPTYQLLGDERDGPRGRIYLIKHMLEGNSPTRRTQEHLDRCLTCRACETACPSGVEYGKIVDIGREVLAQRAPRPWRERLRRRWLRRSGWATGRSTAMRDVCCCWEGAFNPRWRQISMQRQHVCSTLSASR